MAAAVGTVLYLLPSLRLDAYTLRFVGMLRLFRVARIFVRMPAFNVRASQPKLTDYH